MDQTDPNNQALLAQALMGAQNNNLGNLTGNGMFSVTPSNLGPGGAQPIPNVPLGGLGVPPPQAIPNSPNGPTPSNYSSNQSDPSQNQYANEMPAPPISQNALRQYMMQAGMAGDSGAMDAYNASIYAQYNPALGRAQMQDGTWINVPQNPNATTR